METKQLLIKYAAEYETKDFLQGDPSCFMHKVKGELNQEAIAFIASTLSYGTRKVFLPRIQYLLDLSKGDVYNWVKDGKFAISIPDNKECFYRLYTNHHLFCFLSTLRDLYNKQESLHKFVCQDNNNAYVAIQRIVNYFMGADIGTMVPHSTNSACKRICMFLRWMVRDNSAVDLGLWSEIDKRTLIIPMDTHVMQQAVILGLLNNKTASMKAAQKLSSKMAEFFPDDPIKGDFALFGYGVNNK